MTVELRPNDKGEFDELVASNATIHIEMMDKDRVWMGIEADGKSYGIWISVDKKKLRIFVEDQS